ncbi:hypothetical protein Tco_0999003 [Tanacetum coccineum]
MTRVPDGLPDVILHKYALECFSFLSLKCFTSSEPLNVIVISCGVNCATTCFTTFHDMLRVSWLDSSFERNDPVMIMEPIDVRYFWSKRIDSCKFVILGAELTFEAEVLLLPLARAEDGLFIMTPFKASALNVDFDFKINLIVFGLETGSALSNFFSRRRGVLQTENKTCLEQHPKMGKSRRGFSRTIALIDSGCSGSLIGDKDKFVSDFKEFKGKHNVLFTDKDVLSYLQRSSLLLKDLATEDELKGKQHRASCKKIEERTVREPLELLHMDLFGPVSVESVNRKEVRLVVTDDCSIFKKEINNYADSNEPREFFDELEDLDVSNALFIQLWIAFEEEKKRIALDKGKECVDSTLTLCTANTLLQYWQYHYRFCDDIS